MKPFIWKCRCNCGAWLINVFPIPDVIATDSWESAMEIVSIINLPVTGGTP